MTCLTSRDLREIQQFVDFQKAKVGRLGLKLETDGDLCGWAELMNSAPGSDGLSRTLDPSRNDCRPGNSFWVKLCDRDGSVVACQANRFIETQDFLREWVLTHRLFGDKAPPLDTYLPELCEDIPVIAGRLDFGGGTWVHPEWRGKDLSGVMSQTGRILGIRHWLADYYVGFVKKSARRRNYGAHQLQLKNRRYLLTGRYPGRDAHLDVDLYWMHRHDLIEQAAQMARPVLAEAEL